MIALAVTWMARPGQEAAVADLFRALTAESRKEPGCLQYQVHTHPTDPRTFFIYEQYQDEAGLEEHRASGHFLQYAKGQLPAIAERVGGQIYNPLS